MKIVQQSADILVESKNPMKHIERIGRICYKSEDKMCEGSDKKFIKMLYCKGHYAMLEHFRFIFQVNESLYDALSSIRPKHVIMTNYDRHVISFNATALMNLDRDCSKDNEVNVLIARSIKEELISHIVRIFDCYELFGIDRDDRLPLLSTSVCPIKNDAGKMSQEEWNMHGWMSVHMITDRGITHEIVRHREETSFAQESTRYCNYSHDRHGNEITIINQGFHGEILNLWFNAMECAESTYFKLLNLGVMPQMARSVLPTCLKTEIVMTAPIYEWEHFFDLRLRGTTGAPHPLIKDLSKMIYNQLTLHDKQRRI